MAMPFSHLYCKSQQPRVQRPSPPKVLASPVVHCKGKIYQKTERFKGHGFIERSTAARGYRMEHHDRLVNGENVQFEYNSHQKAVSKKKKKKHSKVHVTDVQLENPDEDYPESRVLKQDRDGSLLIQKLEPTKPKKHRGKAHENGLLPSDPEELNQQLGDYWSALSVERKKELLNMERDSVFKIMRDQQKITCNCSVCGRKRSIIEQELKKLYDTYYEGIENSHMLLSELFNFSKEEQQQLELPKPQSKSQRAAKINPSDQKGIMTIAEDLLQNDGRKFLEMMERLAETRIRRHTELLKNAQKEEEDEDEYYSDDHIDDMYLEDSQHFGQAHDTLQSHALRHSDYKIPPRENLPLIEDPVSLYWTKSDEENYCSNDDPDYDSEQEEEDELTDDDVAPEYLGLSMLTEFHKEMLDLLEEQQDMLEDGYNVKDNASDQKILEMHIMRQKLLQRQLKEEHEKLKHFHDHPPLDIEPEFDDEDLEDLEDEEIDEDDLEDDEDEQDDDDLEDEESLSDEPVDEEQQLAEGRAMLQLCATKMLRQSLLQSYKETLIKKQAENLLEELQEDAEQERRREEKKQREREKKKEKKRLLQQQKEEERQKKIAEEERLLKEKREEMIRKTEEGRKRKQEEERKKREEQHRKEEEAERQRKAKEEKRRLKDEQKRIEEAKLREAEEVRILKDLERMKLQELEQQKMQQEREFEEQRLRSIEAKNLQERFIFEESRLQAGMHQSRSNSNISVPDFHGQTSRFEPIQQAPFSQPSMVPNPPASQYNPLQQGLFPNLTPSPWQTPTPVPPTIGQYDLLGNTQQPNANDMSYLLGSLGTTTIGNGTPPALNSNSSFMQKDTLWGSAKGSSSWGHSASDGWNNQMISQQVSHVPQAPMLQNDAFNQFAYQSMEPEPVDKLQQMVKDYHFAISQAYQSLPKGPDGYVRFEDLLATAQRLTPALSFELTVALFAENSDEYRFDMYRDGSDRIQFVKVTPKGFTQPRSRHGSSFLSSFDEPSATIGFNNGFETRSNSGVGDSLWSHPSIS